MALDNGNISQTTIKCVCLSALVLTLALSGSNLIAFFAMDESPLVGKSVAVCFYGVSKPPSTFGFVTGALPLLICCGLFLSHDIMTVRLLRTNATNNLEIQRRRYVIKT